MRISIAPSERNHLVGCAMKYEQWRRRRIDAPIRREWISSRDCSVQRRQKELARGSLVAAHDSDDDVRMQHELHPGSDPMISHAISFPRGQCSLLEHVLYPRASSVCRFEDYFVNGAPVGIAPPIVTGGAPAPGPWRARK